MKNMKNFVQKAIKNTKEILPEYWNSTVEQRSSVHGAGSVYEATPEEIEKAVLVANWEETTHPDVMPGCRVFKSNIGLVGYLGLMEVQENQTYTIDDRKNIGKVSLTIQGQRGKEVEETYLIVGEEQGKEVVFTFHPGEPIRPSKISVENYPHGSKISGKEALKLGFKYAKVI